MPGREDLIQKNAVKAAKASAVANTPQPQEREGKSATSSMGGPRSLFGGNIDVYSALDKIEFQKGLGDGSLRGNIAYIRLWKRGSTQQSSASQQTVQPPQSDSQEILKENLEAAIENRDSVANGYNEETGKYSYDPYGNVDNPIEVAEANIQIAENQLNKERQRAIASQTPTASAAPSTTITTAPKAPKASATTAVSKGGVKSANPNGLLNIAKKVGGALIGLPQGKPEYSGKLNDKSTSAMAPEAMWQFLFNPSELELEVGPEFKNAEVWGVSDKGNSGQPLHWSHNKNAQLKFNSVLLNGYVFGRKVEALEQGLIELFMARDGEGQHGPHVLEFVWGKRVFGPCVMKNINIKEKMWDEGEVVNAEVSFTLEQVPEWTINDGFVDVARPGRQPLITNPVPGAAGAATPATPAGAATPNANSGPGNSSSQKPTTVAKQGDFVGCKALQELKINATEFNPFPGNYYTTPPSIAAIIAGAPSNDKIYRSNFPTNYKSYNSYVAKGNGLGVSTSSKCSPAFIQNEYNRLTKNSSDSLKQTADKQLASSMNTCAAELGTKAGGFFDQRGCGRFFVKPNNPAPNERL